MMTNPLRRRHRAGFEPLHCIRRAGSTLRATARRN